MRCRVALIDSGIIAAGEFQLAGSVRFTLRGDAVTREALVCDPTGHGTRVARLIASAAPAPEFLVAQVFDSAAPTTAAVVAAAIHWAVDENAHLLHLSLGLAADRAILRAAIEAAIAAGCIVVAATPARGAASFPASYPGVIQASGDARCAPDELSWLRPAASHFGGCPREAVASGRQGGASIGAAYVTRTIVQQPFKPGVSVQTVVQQLRDGATYVGRERTSGCVAKAAEYASQS